MKTRRAVIVGFDFFSKFLAGLINEHSTRWRARAYGSSRSGALRAIFALRRADALICFGGPGPDTVIAQAARRASVPVFVIWAGTDVIKAQEDPFSLELLKQEPYINIASSPWLVGELETLGIRADYLPVTAVRSGGPIKPFPRQFRVLTYLPEPRREFYGAELVYAVAREMPDVPFMVVGPGSSEPAAPANVKFCGLVNDMEDRIDACTVVLRVPKHDSASMLVLEGLSRARHVVWNYELPGVTTAKTEEGVLAALRKLRASHASRELELNFDGRAYVLEHFSRADVAARLEARLQAPVGRVAAQPRRARYRVALSGLELFCAEVAHYAKMYAPEWEPHVLRTNSRVNVLLSIGTLASSDVWYTIGSPITDRWVHLASRLLRKPHVIHWVGSDIASLCDQPRLLRAVQGRSTLHLAEVEWTAAQLRSFGLDPQIAPLPPRHCNAVIKPLPKKFTIMLYVPRTRAVFYGQRTFEHLMKALCDQPVRYIVVGGGDIEAPPGVDVENLGWRNNLEDIYERVTTLIRYTPRDGLSLMVLEALCFGRHVLWTQSFPFTRQIHNYGDMEREVRELLQLHLRGELQPQTGAAEAIQRQYSPRRSTAAIAHAWSEAANTGVNVELAAEPS